MSEITNIDKLMTSFFTGITVDSKLLKVIYGDNNKLIRFIKRLEENQTMTNNLYLPSGAMFLQSIKALKKDRFLLKYRLNVVTGTTDEANQITEKIYSLCKKPVPIDQSGVLIAHKDKYAKMTLKEVSLYSVLDSHVLEGKNCVRSYYFNLVTNYEQKPLEDNDDLETKDEN